MDLKVPNDNDDDDYDDDDDDDDDDDADDNDDDDDDGDDNEDDDGKATHMGSKQQTVPCKQKVMTLPKKITWLLSLTEGISADPTRLISCVDKP